MPLDKPSTRIYYGENHGVKPASQTPRPPKPSSQNSKTVCEHKYRILDSDVNNVCSGSKIVYSMVKALFYCEKCLDIRYIDMTISFEE
jgi:hypothetical protein